MKLLDRTDQRILSLLQKNARLSNKELAAAVDLAPSSCLTRVRRLEETGVLQGFHGRIDPRKAGIGLQALVAVRLTTHSRTTVEAFHTHALSLAEVTQIYHVTGRNDFLVQVAVRDDNHLRDLTLSAFTERPEVARIETTLVFAHEQAAEMPIYGVLP